MGKGRGLAFRDSWDIGVVVVAALLFSLQSPSVRAGSPASTIAPELESAVAVSYQNSSVESAGLMTELSEIVPETAPAGLEHPVTQSLTTGGQAYWTFVREDEDRERIFDYMVPVKVWF